METLARSANRGSISTDTGYTIDNSVKLESDNSERFIRNSGVGTNVSVTNATVSYWVKRTELGAGTMYTWRGTATWQNAAITNPAGYSDVLYVAGGNESYYKLVTNRVFRDTSAWYHIFIAYDTTQSTASDRIKIYINGVRETSFAVENYPAQNRDLEFLHVNGKWIFGWLETATSVAPCYLAEAYLFHDQTLAPTDFGEFDADTGIWKPIEYTGSFSQYDWYYDFENASSLGADASGNGNDITYTYNITSVDQATDTPTNNFCILNAVNLSTQTVTEGATKIFAADNTARTAYGTMAPSSGKWWWEGKIQVFEGTAYACIGVTTNLAGLPSTSAQNNGGHCIKLAKAQKWVLNSTGTSYGTAYSDNDIINVGLDLDNKKFYTYKNGTIDDANGIDISSTTFDNFGSQWMPLVIVYGSGASGYELNFGGYCSYTISSGNSDANGYGNFEYAPPSGYYALCSKNLAEFG